MTQLRITLAGKTYEVAPLTLGQLEDLSAAAATEDTKDAGESVRRSFKRTLGAIAAALSEAYPDMTEAALRKLRSTRREMLDAYNAVLLFSGLIAPRSKHGLIVEARDAKHELELMERLTKEGLRCRSLPEEDRKPAGEPEAALPTGSGSTAS